MKHFLGTTIFLFHAAFVTFWCGLFLIPESLFPDRVSFHFYLTIVVVFHQFVWGLLIMPWAKKYRMVCIFTTITQVLRGQKISDPKNYDHSFTQELFKEIGIKIPHRAATFITFSVLTLVTIQYLIQG
ncbi:MAG: hypothetical protein ABIA08_01590 [bacterium]